tara:strand:+ start:188 stop:370 length:183 start_codon:yes stop_codon:yes gene_type:complete
MKKSQEETVAEKITDSLDRTTLNLDDVGKNIARMSNVHFNRLMIVAEAAEFEQERLIERG